MACVGTNCSDCMKRSGVVGGDGRPRVARSGRGARWRWLAREGGRGILTRQHSCSTLVDVGGAHRRRRRCLDGADTTGTGGRCR